MYERFETKWIAVDRTTVGKGHDSQTHIFSEVNEAIILNYILLARAVYYYTPDSGTEHEAIITAEVNTAVGDTVVKQLMSWFKKNRAIEIVPTQTLPIDPISPGEVEDWFATHPRGSVR